jgi:hypothetical protein
MMSADVRAGPGIRHIPPSSEGSGNRFCRALRQGEGKMKKKQRTVSRRGRARRRPGFSGTPGQREFKRLIVEILRRARAG